MTSAKTGSMLNASRRKQHLLVEMQVLDQNYSDM